MKALTKLLLALTPMGAAARLRGGAPGSLPELLQWASRGAGDRGVASGDRGLTTSQAKKVLVAVMAVGAAAMFLGYNSTFATFSAETSNGGSSFSSGTLTMSDQVNSGTVCLSANGATQNNVNPACSAVLNLTNVAPGVFGGTAQVTIQNTGSIDASKFYVYAPYANATLSSGLSGTVTSLPVTALEGSVANADSITVTYGTHTQTFTANGATAGGATAIAVNSVAANFAYPSGSLVSDTRATRPRATPIATTPKTTTPGTVGATKGTDLNFNPTDRATRSARRLLTYVQETTCGKSYCWYGKGSSPES